MTKLRLKEIEIDNFKSFGKRTTVPLLPGFTTISGPNGSGKSNIIDSILFALGLSTSRTMRAERLPDLINNLSGKKEAQVIIRFTNDIETEIEITRKIKVKDNGYTSTYYMDGKTVTLTEIHDRLLSYNVSPHGYNVVMQGDVTSIISMSQVERRKIIDELAGVADFDRKIELAQIELLKVQEGIEKENIIMLELDERLKQLESERNEALKYAKLKNELRELEKHCLAARINKLEAEYNSLKEENTTLRQKRTDSIIKLGQLNDEIEKDKQTIQDIENEVQKITEQSQKKLIEEAETAKIEISRTQSTVDFLNKQIKDHKDNIENLENEIKILDKKVHDLERKKEKQKKEQEKIEDELWKLNQEYQKLQDSLKSKGQNQNLSTSKILEIQKKINKLKSDKEELMTKKTRLEEQIIHLKDDLMNTKIEAEKSLAELKELTQSSEFKNSKLNQLQQKHTALQRHISKLKAEEIETKEELNERTKKLARLERELDKLEVHKQVIKETTGLGAAVETILSAGIKGVHGTLAQLVYVDEKYKIAIEIATGNRLKSIVVDTDETASKCIELLRSTNSGRATFLPLSKLKPSPTLLPPAQKGVVGFALDLIKFDKKYTDAFYYALTDTLIMDNLDNARKNIGKNRMVTLTGDLLEKSGAITGGSQIKSNINFGQSSENEHQRLQREIKSLQDYVNQLDGDLKELSKQIEEAKEEFDSLKTEITKEETNSSSVLETIKKLTKISEDSKQKVTELAATIETSSVELEKFDEKVKEKEQEIVNFEVELQQVAANVKDSSLEALVTNSQDIESKTKELEAKLQEIITESRSYSVEAEFSLKAKEQYEEKINNSKKEIERISNELPEHEAKLKTLEEKVKEIEEAGHAEMKHLNELNIKRSELSNSLITKGEQKGELQQLIDQLAERVTADELKLRELEPDLTDLRAKFQEQTQNEEYKPPEIIDLDKITKQIESIEKRMRALEPVNMRAIDEYDNVTNRQKEIKEKLTLLSEEKDAINNKISSYTEQKKITFFETFEGVNKYFQEIFHELSFGHGELLLENPDDPFVGGLIIRARPRDKKMQRLEAMSGGEKSLTALSFMFALQRYSPAPFYAFDEVDMFLDSINAERLAQMVKQQSSHAQFVVVSLRRHMLNNANQAIGVTLRADGFTQILGVQNLEKKKEPELMTA
ncbi:MAG: chromosome segregation protein SMC [Candidatus Melainabacteria bacterium RIFCSPLOWO2_12_FULL_35_11]|nr:MAG: chromosome segregation protein SMC [Candidatus Melainabacteria bacterium RIFCSPLOWO2_12_FULL_35_11]